MKALLLSISILLSGCASLTPAQQEAADTVTDTVIYRLLYLVSP